VTLKHHQTIKQNKQSK